MLRFAEKRFDDTEVDFFLSASIFSTSLRTSLFPGL